MDGEERKVFFPTEKWTWVVREGSKYFPDFKSWNPNFWKQEFKR